MDAMGRGGKGGKRKMFISRGYMRGGEMEGVLCTDAGSCTNRFSAARGKHENFLASGWIDGTNGVDYGGRQSVGANTSNALDGDSP